ncbi:MAG: hypothetical protein ACRCWF_13735 [Beijerinckiaceae bacterium]
MHIKIIAARRIATFAIKAWLNAIFIPGARHSASGSLTGIHYPDTENA